MSWLSSFFSVAEADVLAIIQKIKQGVVVAETDLNKIAQFVTQETPTILSDLAMVAQWITQLGIVSPAVSTAITEANVIVQALNAWAAAKGTTGTNDIEAAIQGYLAFTQAQGAVAAAKTAAVSSPVATAPSTTTAQ
jgi:ABC-type bacteriocin/lantibiotic exporter with double-glycine peptidase domain